MGDTRNYAALDWVIDEIGETLKDARQSLEAFVEDPKDVARIRFCLTHIHQVHGSLQMVEFHGASLFAEEMELVAEAIMNETVVNSKEAQEVLMRSLLQLPIYLEQSKKAQDDNPGVVLPLLNDLRAVRKQSYLSETNLFNPDLSSLTRIDKSLQAPLLKEGAKLKQIFQKLREMYQYAAAGVLRGIKIDENLGYIEKVIMRLETITRGTARHSVWEISSGLIQALIRDDVELSVAVRGLFRELARETMVLEQHCPAALNSASKEGLIRNLLFYVARSNAGGERVDFVKKKYKLDGTLTGGASVSRSGLASSPEPEAIKAVILALQDELNTAKHLLDLALSGQGGISDAEEMLPVIKRISDTLAVLGIGDMRKHTMDQHQALKKMCESGALSDSILIDVGGRLADLEHRLEAIAKGVAKTGDYIDVDERTVEIDTAKEAVLNESRSGLEVVKEAIVEALSSQWDPAPLPQAVTTLHDIQGGLNMVPLKRPASLVEACSRYISEQLVDRDASPGSSDLQTLAEAIASIDYYLERLLGGYGENIEGYLHLAEVSLEQLGYYKARDDIRLPDTPVLTDTISSEAQIESGEAADDETLETDEIEGGISHENWAPASEEFIAPEHHEPVDESESDEASDVHSEVVEDEDENPIDEEIVEIFIEEAEEVQETLGEYFPAWSNNLSDNESLAVVRRSFHTLKGSGRMVEAHDVGELAWSVENMLNRVMDGTVPAQNAHVKIIEHALAVTPALINAFKHGKSNPEKAKCEQIAQWAELLAKGEVAPELDAIGAYQVVPSKDEEVQELPEAEVEEPMAEEAAVEQEVEATTEEDEDFILWDIFSSEAETHLAVADEFVADMEAVAPIFELPSDTLQRALHTLKGSAHMAAVTPVAEMITPLEGFVKELRSYQLRVDRDILQLLVDATAYTRDALSQIAARKSEIELPKKAQFIARVEELQAKHIGPLIHMTESGVAEEGSAENASADPRLLTLFMAEEMQHLLDAHLVLQEWQQFPAKEPERLEPLAKELQVLTEGASQANLPKISDLSDQLATLYERAKVEGFPRDHLFFGVMDKGHEGLLDMLDAIAAGQNINDLDPELQSQINLLLALEINDQAEAELERMATKALVESLLGESADQQLDIEPAKQSEAGPALGAEGLEELVADAFADSADLDDSPSVNEDSEAFLGEQVAQEFQNAGLDESDDADDELNELSEQFEEIGEFDLDSAADFGSEEEAEVLGEEAQDFEAIEESIELDASSFESDSDSLEQGLDSLEPESESPELESDSLELEADSPEPELHSPELELHSPELESYSPEESTEDTEPQLTELEQEPVNFEVEGSNFEEDGDDAEHDEEHFTLEAEQPEFEAESSGLEADDDLLSSHAEADDVSESSEAPFVAEQEPKELESEGFSGLADAGSKVYQTHKPLDEAAEGELVDMAEIADDDYDPDILEIFLEEANELIEELDESIHEWESNWDNIDAPENMKRALHTLKGGARLSGLMNLGELTHNYESYLIATVDPRGDERFFQTVLQYQDSLLGGVKAVRAKLDGETPEPTMAPKSLAGDSESAPQLEVDHQAETEDLGVQASRSPAQAPPFDTGNQVLPFPASSQTAASGADASAGQQLATTGFMPSTDTQADSQIQMGAPAAKRTGQQEMIKVSADLLEELVNLAGETSISRGRLEQQVSDLGSAVDEVDATLRRLNEQLRRLDIETEAQVLFRQEQMAAHDEDFDPLEMDRYSQLQQLTRSLMESSSDLVDLKHTLNDKLRDTETMLLQQSRINTSLQEGLMRSRMVPFSRLVPRLRRIVRQVSGELGKSVNFELDNVEGEMDRSVLERMVAPLEHMLRNAVDHGIEMPNDRTEQGKPEAGRILLSLAREGGDILLRLADDGRGINLPRVREKAIERGLMAEDADLSDHHIMQFILQAGFSTAEKVSQISGRGVGMDVVAAEIKQLGGSIVIDSKAGTGSQFTVRLPFTVSVNRALMVHLDNEMYAIPLNSIEGIVRVSPFELEHYYSHPEARFEYAGENYQVRHLSAMLDPTYRPKLDGQTLPLPVILVRSAQHTMALQVDSLSGSREIVVKSLGPQFAAVQGISGATVMGDGSVVVILDPHALVRREMALLGAPKTQSSSALSAPEVPVEEEHQTVMVVDDSVTVRKVTSRFLEREGFNVITAKDGVDALQVLEEEMPDLMLLDIEMPRMDGFEVAKSIRSTRRLKHLPIIMITSRTGDKHRQHALSIGVNEYVGKPYQEEVLLKLINTLLEERMSA